MFDLVVLALPIVTMCFTVWFIICSGRAFRQRIKIIDSASEKTTYDERVAIYNTLKHTSLNKHTWYLLTFRNAMKLYNIE